MIDIAHIHPMLVHFPLALFPVVLGVQFYALIRGQGLFCQGCAQSFTIGLLALAAVTAVAAAMFGDMALDKAVAFGVKLSLLESHEDLGQVSAVLLVLLALAGSWLFKVQMPSMKVSWGFWLAGVTVFVVLIITAWHGGHLVYDLGVNVTIKGR